MSAQAERDAEYIGGLAKRNIWPAGTGYLPTEDQQQLDSIAARLRAGGKLAPELTTGASAPVGEAGAQNFDLAALLALADKSSDGHDRRKLQESVVHISSLRQQVSRQAAEIERLNGIIAKLPKTADGVAIHVGMRFWRIADASNRKFEGWQITQIGRGNCTDRFTWITTNGLGTIATQGIYSTREAALAAMAEARAGVGEGKGKS